MIPLILLILAAHVQTSLSTIISTNYGQLEGNQIKQADGQSLHSFKRVPFAQPPVGELRFALPKPPRKWNSVLNAKEYGPACMSNSSTTTSPQKWVDEDCLHLNIFTSDTCLQLNNCPVVFYMHGGDINYDSAVMFNDSAVMKTFASKDVVLVIAAFRLGIFSHAVLETTDIGIPNLAIYDILRGLEFVHTEIENFGGDNKRVTLFGHSFGGAQSIALGFSRHIDSDHRLFQKLVAMSAPTEFHTLGSQIEATWTFVKRANCTPPARRPNFSQRFRDNFAINCLRRLGQDTLLAIQRELEDEGYTPYEGIVQTGPLFPEKTLQEFLANPKRLPLLTGTTLYELDNSDEVAQIPEMLGYKNPKELYQRYLEDREKGTLPFTHSDKSQTIILGVREQALQMRKAGAEVYLYSYRYPKHAMHTDDLFYLMGVHPFEMDENEKILSEIYPQYFINFIKNGQPTESWLPIEVGADNYFSINYNTSSGLRPKMEFKYEHQVVNYWTHTMKLVDDEITLRKLVELDVYHNRDLPIFEDNADAQTTVFLHYAIPMGIALLLFAVGLLLGRYCFPRSTAKIIYNVNEPLNSSERTPLYPNM